MVNVICEGFIPVDKKCYKISVDRDMKEWQNDIEDDSEIVQFTIINFFVSLTIIVF